MIEKTEKLSKSEKLSFGAFSCSSNIVYQFKSLYYLFFLTNVLHISMATAGTILALGIVWDAINDPLVGYYAINHRFRNGERVRPFALYYSVPWAVTIVLIFTNFHTSEKLTVIIAAIAYFFFELLNTCISITYNCMGGVATNRDEDRRSINVNRNIGGIVGTAIGAIGCMPLLKLFGALDAKGNLIDSASSRGFLLTSIVMGCICIAGSFWHYFSTRERIKQPVETEEKVSLWQSLKILYSYKPFVLNTVYIFCYGIINLLLLTCITYYATYVLGSTSSVTMIQAAYLVASLVASLLVTPIDKKLGRKKTMLLGGICYLIGEIPFALNPFSIVSIYINCTFTGFAVAIAFVMFNTNRNNLTDLIEWKQGRRMDGMIGAADNLATKLGEALAAQLITFSLHLSGWDSTAAVQGAKTINTINAMLGIVPAIIAIFLIITVFFLDIDKQMKKMNDER